MGAKIEINFDLGKELRRAQKEWARTAAPKVKDAVNKQLDRGRSPVKGFGKFAPYTPEYARRKRVSRNAVDLKATGKMRNSLKSRITKTGISLFYTSPIAKFHDLPGLARVLRKMLPSLPGQQFIKKINDLIVQLADQVVKKAINRSK